MINGLQKKAGFTVPGINKGKLLRSALGGALAAYPRSLAFKSNKREQLASNGYYNDYIAGKMSRPEERELVLRTLDNASNINSPIYNRLFGYSNFDLPARIRATQAAKRNAQIIRNGAPQVQRHPSLQPLTPTDKLRLRANVKKVFPNF